MTRSNVSKPKRSRKWFTEYPVSSWTELTKRLSGYRSTWVFRGQRDADWELKTSLERLALGKSASIQAEKAMIETFRRQAHHYLTHVPDPEDTVEWLALMQHHGCPTRLLDWTKSAPVALFFALEERRSDKGNCAVWAVDFHRCLIDAEPILKTLATDVPSGFQKLNWLRQPETLRRLFAEDHELIVPVQPFRLNERLTAQQGLFLCPLDAGASFEDNLRSTAGKEPAGPAAWVHKIVVPNSLRGEILLELNRMNVTHASLFPGLDGFAKSIGLRAEVACRSDAPGEVFDRMDVRVLRAFGFF